MTYSISAKAIAISFLLLLPALLQAQADTPVDTSSNADHSVKKKDALTGIASYYHNKFEGRQMANGQHYSKIKLTAACNVLPLNKWVKVTNLSNGQSVIVKITDRMHPKNKRLIDLSFAAAKKLKIISNGLMKVSVEVLNDDHARHSQ